MLDSDQRRIIEICNTCNGIVGWNKYRDGCCLGGMLCQHPDGTRFIEMLPVEPEPLTVVADHDCIHAETLAKALDQFLQRVDSGGMVYHVSGQSLEDLKRDTASTLQALGYLKG